MVFWPKQLSIGSPWLVEHLIKDAEEYRVVRYIYDNTENVPGYQCIEGA